MNPSEASTDNPIKLEGALTWIYQDERGSLETPAKALIRSNHEIVVEAKWLESLYTVSLGSSDGITFTADFIQKTGAKTWRIKTSCKLWSNKGGHFLFGRWIEGEEDIYWMVELHEAK